MPAFVFVALIGPFAERMRDRAVTSALLDGLNAAAIGLMAAVSVRLDASALVDPVTVTLAAATFGLLLWGRLPSVLLVAAGGLAGLAAAAAGIGP